MTIVCDILIINMLVCSDLAADVPGHDPHEAAAALAHALHARVAVRGRLPPAVPQRLPLQPGTSASLTHSQLLTHSQTHVMVEYINLFLIHKRYSVPYRFYAKTIHNSTHSTHKTSLTLLTVSCKSDGLMICGKPLL